MPKIAMSNWGGQNLYLLYLSPGPPSSSSVPKAYRQQSGGLWNSIAPPANPQQFTTIVGLSGFAGKGSMFIGFNNQDSNFYYLSANTGWTWEVLAAATNYNIGIPFAATLVPNPNFPTGGSTFGLLVTYISTTNSMVQVLYGAPGQMQTANGWATNFGYALGQQMLSIAAPNNEGIVFFSYALNSGVARQLYCWSNPSGDGQTWQPVALPIINNNVISVLVSQTTPLNHPFSYVILIAQQASNTLGTQGVIISDRTPFRNIPNRNPGLPPMSLMAASYGYSPGGATNTLAVVFLGTSLQPNPNAANGSLVPYLVYLNKSASRAYNNEQLLGPMSAALPNNSWNPTNWTQVTDLAIGMGSVTIGYNVETAMIVGYLDAKGNVYTNWQCVTGNTAGIWNWYGGASGSGLP